MLNTKTFPTIGYLTRSLLEARRSPSWGEMMAFAESHRLNLIILVGGMLNSPIGFEAQGNILYDLLNPANVDGLIVTGGLGHYVGPVAFRAFCDRFQPLPLVSLEVLLENYPSVIPDFYAGMFAAVEHLVKVHGRRRIAFVRGAADSRTGEERYRAYQDCLKAYGLPVDADLVAPGTFLPPSGTDAVSLLLDTRRVPFDALVAANDDMAIDAMQALEARGIRVPEDVAVTGFDNLDISHSVIPPLTTVELSTQHEVHHATQLLLAMLRGEPVQHRVDLKTEIVLRQSCGCQSTAMAQADAPVHVPVSGTDHARDLIHARADVLAEMVKSSEVLPTEVALQQAQIIFDAFAQELEGEGEEQFILSLRKMAREVTADSSRLVFWQGALSIHRRLVLPLLNDPLIRQQAENIWQRGRVFLAETALSLEAQERFRANQLEAALRRLGDRLITTFNLDGLMNMLVHELPQLGIPACYLALYQEKESLSKHSRLVLAYNEEGRPELPVGGLVFETRDIIPVEIAPHGRRSSYVVYPLNFHEDRLGFVVFEIGPRHGEIYETLSLQLSSALKGALLVDEAEQARKMALQAQQRAEQADQLKTRLLANVSHELRTPLNVILGYSRMALLDPNPYHLELPAGFRQDLEAIYGSGDHLVRLVNDLLDLSRAEIGELSVYPEALSPRSLLEQSFYSFAKSVAPVQSVTWRLDVPARLPVIRADPTRLRQIVLNLLSNAYKFTESGEIVLGADVTPPHLHLWVKDTAPGIPTDRQERIFEPFFSEGYSDHRPAGIGLGLTITRQLVALHGGSLSLESKPGVGSTFHINLPLPNLSERSLEPGIYSNDMVRPALLLISSLAVSHPEVETLAGRAGWSLVRISATEQVQSTLDLYQPTAMAWDMSNTRPGDWAIIQQLRGHPHLANLPFILFRSEADDAQLSSAGLTNILTKPLNSQNLVDLIQSVQPTSAAAPILIVDDDSQAREVYFRLISERLPGFPITMAEDGKTALHWLDQETPSLVILDLSMPNVDGFAVLEHLRANRRTQITPVIVLTGRLLSFEDVKRLDHNQVVLQFKHILSDEEMLANLQRVFSGAEPIPQPTSQVVKRALVYLQQNFPQTLSRTEIATAVGVSEDYLTRIFSKEVGLSPWDFLLRYRMFQARQLLGKTNQSIGWIAAQVGFQDPAYFARVFQKAVGCSPRTYRANLLKS